MKYDEQINSLKNFRNSYLLYCRNNPRIQGVEDYYLGLTTDGDENSSQAELKKTINESLANIRHLFDQDGESVSIHYSPAPIRGGFAGRVDLLANLFELHKFEIPFSMVIDMTDRVIGVYKFRQGRYSKNRKNPFWWIGEIIRLPFILLKFAGFDSVKFEFSIFGKIIKLFGALIALAAAVVTGFELYEKIVAHLI